MAKKKIIIGILALLLVSSGIFITFKEDLRIEVERDFTQFKVPRTDMPWFWKIAGQEENRLFDGTSIMNRDLSSINISKKINNKTQEVWIKRRTEYIRGPILIDTYYFRGNVESKELFPISHKVNILNASGKFYRYTVDELSNTGKKRDFETQTEFSFGNNMNIEIDSGYRWAWIGWPYGGDSFSVQYDIDSDNETFNVRLFDPPQTTIEGDTVYINNSKAYLSATPHTITKSGYVEFNITSKTYSGDINVIWGFDTSITKPKSGELYNPTNETWNTSHQKDIYNVTSNIATSKECDYGNEYNSIHQEVTYGLTNSSNSSTSTNQTDVFCFNSYTQDGDNYTLTWDTKHWEMKYWYDISGKLGKINYQLDGKDTWYYAQNVPIQANQTYTVRSYIEVKPNSRGKYDFGVYPSSYGTDLQFAYDDGNLYYLDPWWNSSYEERYPHNDNSSGYTGIGYFGTNITGWYGTIGNDAYTYNSTDTTNDYIVANETNELCWFDTQNDRSNCPKKTGSASSLISYWAFDDTGATDWIGTNDGTNSGATNDTSALLLEGYDFDRGDSMDFGGVPIGENNFTIQVIVKPQTYNNEILNYRVNVFGTKPDGSKYNNIVRLQWNPYNNLVRFNLNNGTYKWGQGITGDLQTYLTLGEWSVLTGTYDYSTGEAIFYIDKKRVGTTNVKNIGTLSPSEVTISEESQGGWNYNVDAVYDDIRVHHKTFDWEDVNQSYNSIFQRPYLEETEKEKTRIITWENPTPTDGDTISNDYVYLNTTITSNLNTSAFFDWNKSLIGYWSMDFYNSTGIFDNSSYNNFCEFKGNNFGVNNITNGFYGNGLNFTGNVSGTDGDGTYLDCGNDSSLQPTDELTVETWIRPKSQQETSMNYGVASSAQNWSGSSSWSWQIRYGGPTNNSLGFQLNTVDYSTQWVDLGYNLTTNNWYHIAVLFNGTGTEMYINGVLKDSNNFGSTTIDTNIANKILIGNEGWTNYFNGTIDEFRLYDRVLSPEEINASYNNSIYRLKNNFTDLSKGYYNYSAYAINTAGNLSITDERKVTISADTCSPSSPLSSNYVFNCSDNCSQSTNLDASGYNITFSNDFGHFSLNANITNFDKIFKYDSCTINIFEGGFKK